MREFARGWFAAEQLHDDRISRGLSDWYSAAVVVTCRWLANALVQPETGRWRRELAPLTDRAGMTHPEYVQEEAFEAQNLWERRNKPGWLLARPGWLEAEHIYRRLTRNDFRAFIHPPEGMVRAAESDGLAVTYRHRARDWDVVGLSRKCGSGPSGRACRDKLIFGWMCIPGSTAPGR